MATVKRIADIEVRDMSNGAGIVGVQKRVLIGPADRAPTFAVRQFTLGPGGHTAAHSHPFEHGVIVLRGTGTVLTPTGPVEIGTGSVVFVPPGEHHQFQNTGPGSLEFLCVIPIAHET